MERGAFIFRDRLKYELPPKPSLPGLSNTRAGSSVSWS
jgi:hypothetical protein